MARIGPAEVRERTASIPTRYRTSSRCAAIRPTRSQVPVESARRRPRRSCQRRSSGESMIAAGRFAIEAEALRISAGRHARPAAPLPDFPISAGLGGRRGPQGGRRRRLASRLETGDGVRWSSSVILRWRNSIRPPITIILRRRRASACRGSGRAECGLAVREAIERVHARTTWRGSRASGGVLARRRHDRPADDVGGGPTCRRVLDRRSRERRVRTRSAPRASRDARHAMGFCLFGNVVVAARHAQEELGLERIAIVDWDVHHGNGTEALVRGDDSVLFMSMHQWPFYPGSGGPGTSDATIAQHPARSRVGRRRVRRGLSRRSSSLPSRSLPGLLIVSAGFDAHADDPLAEMRVTAAGFGSWPRAAKLAPRVSAVLEGGYNLETLPGADRGCAPRVLA